jgi:hypothetical protein
VEEEDGSLYSHFCEGRLYALTMLRVIILSSARLLRSMSGLPLGPP